MITDSDIHAALVEHLKERGAATILAERLGISRSYLSQIKSGDKRVPARVARFLGYRRVTTWERV